MATISIPNSSTWNENVLTVEEQPSGMGDRLLICIHSENDSPHHGTTVLVLKSDFIRLAKMVAAPYEGDTPSNHDEVA